MINYAIWLLQTNLTDIIKNLLKAGWRQSSEYISYRFSSVNRYVFLSISLYDLPLGGFRKIYRE